MGVVVDYLLGLLQSLPWGVVVLSVLGTLDVVGSVIVKTTTSVKDDEWLKKAQEHKILGPLLKALEKFSYFDLKK